MKQAFVTVLAILFITFSKRCQAQTIASDSRGKEVFNFYKSKSLTIPVSVSTSSIKMNYTFKVGEGTQFYVNRFQLDNGNWQEDSIAVDTPYNHIDSLRFTLAKSTGINISVGAGNLVNNLVKVSTFHPTYTASVGIGRNIDVFNNWNLIETLRYPFFTWNLNFNFDKNNVLIYDTLIKGAFRKRPWSESISAEGTLYFPSNFFSNHNHRMIALSGSIRYEFGNNIDKLKSYQENKPSYSNAEVISLGDVVGKLGDLADKELVRGRISLPFFPGALKILKSKAGTYQDSLQFCIIPYYSFYGPVNTQVSHLVGVYVNVNQGDNLFARNSTITSGFGIGVDWNVTANGFKSGSVFVAGSLDIHKLFAHRKPKKG
ncbi:MAG: hypothetical protein EOP04_17235 [Proteobacteria bacterium]|nr:MAG: hypothetical protein EOP04_17235 [Pseudomonadota bacterium]